MNDEMSDQKISSKIQKIKCLSSEDSDQSEEQERYEEYGKGGYHCVRIGDTFCEDRYQVIRKLGWGVFSTVWLCIDNKYNEYVAIKIVKSKRSYCESAIDEINMLSNIKRADPKDPFAYRVVTFLDHFTIKGINGRHHCLVFEVMGDSLYKFLTTYFKKGIPIEGLKPIFRQILEGLAYLHTKCGIIHTDIKPENILLTVDKTRVKRMHSEVENLIGVCGESQLPGSFVSIALIEDKQKTNGSKYDSKLESEFGNKVSNRKQLETFDEELTEISIKIADFGNGCHVDDNNNYTIQTRPYRSPEVILGLGFDTSADIWSTACMFFELATGESLFDYDHKDRKHFKNETHLARIIQLLGPLPKICKKGKHYPKYFTKSGRLYNYKVIDECPLDTLLIQKYEWEPTLAKSFAQFLLPMLQMDPKKRAAAKESLSDEWL